MVSAQKVDRELMRKSNMKLVLFSLRQVGEASKAQLAEMTGMSVVSVGRITDELLELKLLQESEKELAESTVGRPPKVLSLATDQLLCCGAHLDREVLHLGVVDPVGVLREKCTYNYPEECEFLPEHVLPWMADCMATFLKEREGSGILRSIGVVVPGIVDIERGEMQFSANFRWRNVEVTRFLKERLPGYDFYLENDTKAIAVAEYRFGAAAGARNMVVLSLGDGIGSAAILNGEIYRGWDNMAGEIGHIILNPAGKICECGQVGCLQTNLAKRAILNEARSVYRNITMEELFDYFQRGDPFAVALVGQVVDYTSIAINLLANAYAPETVLLCGSTLWENPILRSLVERNYKSRLNEYMQNAFELRFDTFGENGYIVGGSALAFYHVVDTLLVKNA